MRPDHVSSPRAILLHMKHARNKDCDSFETLPMTSWVEEGEDLA